MRLHTLSSTPIQPLRRETRSDTRPASTWTISIGAQPAREHPQPGEVGGMIAANWTDRENVIFLDLTAIYNTSTTFLTEA